MDADNVLKLVSGEELETTKSKELKTTNQSQKTQFEAKNHKAKLKTTIFQGLSHTLSDTYAPLYKPISVQAHFGDKLELQGLTVPPSSSFASAHATGAEAVDTASPTQSSIERERKLHDEIRRGVKTLNPEIIGGLSSGRAIKTAIKVQRERSEAEEAFEDLNLMEDMTAEQREDFLRNRRRSAGS